MLKTLSNIVAVASYITLALWFFFCVLHPCIRCATLVVVAAAGAAFATYARRGF